MNIGNGRDGSGEKFFGEPILYRVVVFPILLNQHENVSTTEGSLGILSPLQKVINAQNEQRVTSITEEASVD